jgi:undecaprenyl-diphosphatase
LSLLHAILLGLIQGLTEFLPISSTAHLTLAGKLLGLIDAQNPEAWTSFMAVVQLGTLVAVIWYFYKDLYGIARATARDLLANSSGNGPKGYSRETRFGLYVMIGTVPILVLGFVFSRVIRGVFTKNLVVIVASLVILALLLWLAERVARMSRTEEHITAKDAIIVGIAQALALIPGSSRSGTTITAALFLNFTRHTAARFSFLLSIPAVFASGVYELTHIQTSAFELGIVNLVVATIIAGVSGYFAIYWLLRFLWSHTVMVFVWYRIGLGLVLSALLMAGVIQP